MRRAPLVQQIELLETEHSPPPPGEVCRSGAAHPAQADDDGVVAHAAIMATGSIRRLAQPAPRALISWDCRSSGRRNGRLGRGVSGRTGRLDGPAGPGPRP